jgi:hypothetical protein
MKKDVWIMENRPEGPFNVKYRIFDNERHSQRANTFKRYRPEGPLSSKGLLI